MMHLALALSMSFTLPLLAAASDFESLRLRYREMLVGGPGLDLSDPRIAEIARQQGYQGRSAWEGLVKSASADRSQWFQGMGCETSVDGRAAYSCFSRLRAMALGYAQRGSEVYGNAALLADLVAALRWLNVNYFNEKTTYDPRDWFWFEVHPPNFILDTVLLAYEGIPVDLRASLMRAILHVDPDVTRLGGSANDIATGFNLVAKVRIGLLEAMISESTGRLNVARNAVAPVFDYVEVFKMQGIANDGFFRDGSCLFHRYFPYNGGYCADGASGLSTLVYLLDQSPWAFEQAKKDRIASWVFDSFEPFVHGGATMDMVRGRDNTSSSRDAMFSARGFIQTAVYSAGFAPPEVSLRLKRMVKAWFSEKGVAEGYFRTSTGTNDATMGLLAQTAVVLNDPDVSARPELIGAFVFPIMDRAVQLKPGWGLGLSLQSSRIWNYEYIGAGGDGRNLRGWHTADGMTYLYNGDTDHFRDAFWVTVDMQRLPGTTVIAGSTPQPQQHAKSPNVGMSALDGAVAAMMEARPPESSLLARKSWFSFVNEVVAIGTAVSASDPRTVETIVENRRIAAGPGDAQFTHDTGQQQGLLPSPLKLRGVRWAHLKGSVPANDIGYYFPQPRDLTFHRERRSGSLSDGERGASTALLERDYATLWFDHGASPSNASYAYVLLPGCSADAVAAYSSASAVKVVEASAFTHVVDLPASGFRGATFFSSTGGQAAGIRVSGVAVVLVHQVGDTIAFAVADPTQLAASLTMEWADGAGAIISQDAGITVLGTSPLRLSINTRDAYGKSFRISLKRSPSASIDLVKPDAPSPFCKSAATSGNVIEYYNASLDHYFITWVPAEIANLDSGRTTGWARTGQSFKVFTAPQTGTAAVCRIYIPPGKGDGHFFGRDLNECDGTMTKNPSFILESPSFFYLYPPGGGTCAAGTVPVYRVFSNRADANHRYTTDRVTRDQMTAKGWIAEGDGADVVVMCAPS
ncbi:MAG: hypothetical protein IT518_22015 [Burkholderiales bacterium]|nr:hypothetical protein [Burkholderiales bacterium]